MEKWNLIQQSRAASNLIQISLFMVTFLVVFQALYYGLRKFWKTFQQVPDNLQPGTVLRITSSIHAILATLFSLYILYSDKELSQNKILFNSSLISFTLNMSQGFLLYDMVMMLIYRNEFEWNYVIHHFVSIIAFFACSTVGVFPFIALVRLTSEGSTPFINTRWLLLTLNMKQDKLYLYNGIATIVIFFFVRIFCILPNWFIFFSSVNTPAWYLIDIQYKLICVGSCIPLDILNLLWFRKIVNIVIKYLRAESKVNLNTLKQK